jgi:hypothetical protein
VYFAIAHTPYKPGLQREKLFGKLVVAIKVGRGTTGPSCFLRLALSRMPPGSSRRRFTFSLENKQKVAGMLLGLSGERLTSFLHVVREV